jgi:hypothetical protein
LQSKIFLLDLSNKISLKLVIIFLKLELTFSFQALDYHPRTQGLFGKDPGIVWSRESTKINCPRGSSKVSNYMLQNVTVNFKYQEWDFTIHSSKRPLTSILYFCLLLNCKSTVAFYQQSSQETNKSYTLKFEVGYSLSNIFSYQTCQSSSLYIIFSLLFVSKICHL